MAMQILDPASDGGRSPLLIATALGGPGTAHGIPGSARALLGVARSVPRMARGLPATGAV